MVILVAASDACAVGSGLLKPLPMMFSEVSCTSSNNILKKVFCSPPSVVTSRVALAMCWPLATRVNRPTTELSMLWLQAKSLKLALPAPPPPPPPPPPL